MNKSDKLLEPAVRSPFSTDPFSPKKFTYPFSPKNYLQDFHGVNRWHTGVYCGQRYKFEMKFIDGEILEFMFKIIMSVRNSNFLI